MLPNALPIVACAISLSCAAAAQGEEAPEAPTRASQEAAGSLDMDAVFALAGGVRPERGSFYGWLPGTGEDAGYLALHDRDEGQPVLSRRALADGALTPLFDSSAMVAAFDALPGITEDQARRWTRGARAYLTDDPVEVSGVNSPEQLAVLDRAWRERHPEPGAGA